VAGDFHAPDASIARREKISNTELAHYKGSVLERLCL
jgi:hypothetical protein